ncbi:MAG: sensor protein [Gemmatimonadetes bacterium]|nr:sensor protein [Gemmatimonadota bacterium]
MYVQSRSPDSLHLRGIVGDRVAAVLSLRYVATIAAACLFALSAVAVTFYFLTQRTERWLDHSREVTSTTERALRLAIDRETGIRGYLLTHDSTNLEPERSARAALPGVLNTLMRLTADDPAESARAHATADVVARWDREFAAKVLAGDIARAHDPLAGKTLFDDIRRTIGVFLAEEARLLAERRAHDSRMRTLAAVVFILESLFFAALFIVFHARAGKQGRELAAQYEQLSEQAFEIEMHSTEAQEQSAAHAMSEERYRTLAESLPFGVVLQGADTSFQLANTAAADLLGVKLADLRGRSSDVRVWQVVRRDGTPFPIDQLAGTRALATGKRESDVVGVIRLDGSLAWLRLTAQPVGDDPASAPTGVVISLVDITAQRLAEESSLKSTALIEAVVQASPVAIMTLDTNLCITSWNSGAERLFGWTSAEVMGARYPIVPDAMWTEYLVQHGTLLREGRTSDERRVLRRKDGSTVVVSVSASLLRDDSGEVVGAVMVALDLTERERLEADLRQAQKMEAVGQLAGGVAHDFNNLLTIILNYAQMNLAELPYDGTLSQDLREISDAATKAAGLTRQLLTFSRRQVIQVSELDLNHVMRSITPMLGRLLGSSVQLSTALDPNLWTCLVDRGQIDQVIMNLAVNARDAMPMGGPLVVGTANLTVRDEDVQHYDGMPPGRYVTLCVRDSGIGMDASTRSHIFEPFFTTKAPGEGTGLGLATVYGIVKQSQGFIKIESEVGKGTEFRISLPVVDVAPNETSPSQPDDTEAGVVSTPGTILVVDDVAAIRNLSRSILERQGHTVLEAANGDLALRLIASRNGAVDLVISDIEMPQMGGLELMRQLGEQFPHIPITLVSGYSEELLLRRGVLSRRVGFIEKPYTASALQAAVSEVLHRTQRGSAPPALDPSVMPLIAIVDDMELNRILAAAILEDTCMVMSHAGGFDTVRDLAARKPALILLDIEMPELDGFEVLRGIRENETLRHVPVIAFTARVSDADQRMFEAAGFDDYIGKPLTDFEAFRARVVEGVNRRSSARAPVRWMSSPAVSGS